MIDHQLFIRRLYTESYTLVVEARNYFHFTAIAPPQRLRDNPADLFFVNYQAMRFTSRMTQAMAWLLAQRAVQTGELTLIEACGGAYSLGGERICTDLDGHNDNRVPTGMRHLLDRSHTLYHRVWRLDQAAREKVTTSH